jgi:hypothetical protein
MSIIFDADVTGEPADRFESRVALRGGWPVNGPFDRGLRSDVGFVPPRGKNGVAIPRLDGNPA